MPSLKPQSVNNLLIFFARLTAPSFLKTILQEPPDHSQPFLLNVVAHKQERIQRETIYACVENTHEKWEN